MYQVIQNQKNGELIVETTPAPHLRRNGVLVRNVCSLVSAGTERTSVATAQASMLGKARSRPDLVKQVLDEVKRNGVVATYKKVRSRLDNFKELGYSSAGVVLASSTEAFKAGDRVACGGAGYAAHAEQIFVPQNLAAIIPDDVTFDEAAFATIGAIALQGVRQADVRLGECVAVVGLGLVGLLAVQLLKAAGCRVIGLDINQSNFELAEKLGCDKCMVSNHEAVRRVDAFSRGHGADAVIITAATKSNAPVELAIQFARRKAKIVIVGAVGMNLPRTPFYEKELDVRISCSYGPGRYDSNYEEGGHDYPIGYVRWTENRNMQAVLDLLAQKKLDVKSLITHRFPVEEALSAYDLITGRAKEKSLGVIIEYPSHGEITGNGKAQHHLVTRISSQERLSLNGEIPVVGFVGVGNFAQAQLLPPLKKMGVRLRGVANARSVSAKSIANKHEFEFCTTDAREVIDDPEIDAVFIATRHDLHAELAIAALEKGKAVFVEKPLALTRKQLEAICEAQQRTNGRLMVGFNRQFAPHTRELCKFFEKRAEPMVVHYRVNAGFIDSKHWVHDHEQGGGRLLGEVCHFIDLVACLIGAPIRTIYAVGMANAGRYYDDNLSISINFADGSLGNILYVANGDVALPKERLEVFCEGAVAMLDDFCRLELYRDGRSKVIKKTKDKGHRMEVEAFVKAIREGGDLPLSFLDCVMSTRATLRAMESLQQGVPLPVEDV